MCQRNHPVHLHPPKGVVAKCENRKHFPHIGVVIGWEAVSYAVDEADGEVELCAAILNGTLGARRHDVNVLLPTTMGTAEKGTGGLWVGTLRG